MEVYSQSVERDYFELIDEKKISDLIHKKNNKFEASGVASLDGFFYVIFDNHSIIAKIPHDLNKKESQIIKVRPKVHDIEAISIPESEGPFYLIREAKKFGKQYLSILYRVDFSGKILDSLEIPFPFREANKGAEGLSIQKRNDKIYLFVLFEKEKESPKEKGRFGSLLIYEWKKFEIKELAFLDLSFTGFKDFSDLSIRDDRIAIVSQESSALWVGKFDFDRLEIQSDGEFYRFPRDKNGKHLYCSIEGVSWIDEKKLVFVSDVSQKRKRHLKCKPKDASIHIFQIKE
ncbi:MAG: hypothetical protein H7A24_03870 [Leptospiraceae bacterium]|nr:hypothetical protein [Leptospiraceae bacterium]MCP5510990.1 hypothetical protein [Leptospiraceae bacterium]